MSASPSSTMFVLLVYSHLRLNLLHSPQFGCSCASLCPYFSYAMNSLRNPFIPSSVNAISSEFRQEHRDLLPATNKSQIISTRYHAIAMDLILKLNKKNLAFHKQKTNLHITHKIPYCKSNFLYFYYFSVKQNNNIYTPLLREEAWFLYNFFKQLFYYKLLRMGLRIFQFSSSSN